MPKLTAYLGFDGNCAEAMHFYEKALGGTVELMTFAQAPASEGIAAELGHRIMHAALMLPGGGMLYASDMPQGVPFMGIQGVGLTLDYDSVEHAEQAFNALAAGGTVTMPLAPSFWIERFGMLTDRFGVGWMVNGGAFKM